MGLFRWFRNTILASAGSSRQGFVLPDGGPDEAIAAIAALRSESAIREAARQFPPRFGPAAAPLLRDRIDVLGEPPAAFSARQPGVTAWADCWWFALGEILYQYREHALPVLRGMAGSRLAGSAVVLLCRLAAVGIDRTRIVTDVTAQMPDLPDDLRLEIAASLGRLARSDPALAAVVEELRQEPAFERALDEARQFDDE